MDVDWVEGETAPRDFILKEDGEPKDLTGLTVTLELWKRDGTAVTTTGDLAVITPQTGADVGRVRLTPDADDLVAADSPLRARFKASDLLGGFGYFPRGEPMIWRVRKP